MQRRLTCPRAPHHSLAAASKLYCQLCWRPLVRKSRKGYPQPHPCLFCPSCRQECAKKPEPHRPLKLHRNAGGSTSRELTAQAEDGIGSGQGREDYYHCGNSEILLNDSLIRSSGVKKDRGGAVPASTETRPIVYRSALSRREKRTFQKKLHELEMRATRCGFCPRDERHRESPLVSYCCFCGKHLCQKCHLIHREDTLYKHHPTIDLTRGVNTALQ